MKNKNFLPALTLFAFVWILGFVVSKVLLHMGASWWWILLPLPIGVILVLAFQANQDYTRVGSGGLPFKIIIAIICMIVSASWMSFWFLVQIDRSLSTTSETFCGWMISFLSTSVLLIAFALFLFLIRQRWVWYGCVFLAGLNALLYLVIWLYVLLHYPESPTCSGINDCLWWVLFVGGPLLLLVLSVVLLLMDKKRFWKHSATIDKKHLLSVLVMFVFSFLLIGSLSRYQLTNISGPVAYNADRERIEYAIASHKNIGIPIINSSLIIVNGSEVFKSKGYHVIAMCPLLGSSYPKGVLYGVPPTTHKKNCIKEGDNIGSQVTDCAADCTGSYLWLTTEDGDIASICIGEGCAAHGEDGYQGVYP